MKKEYDFSRARDNHYAKHLDKPVTEGLDEPKLNRVEEQSDKAKPS